MQCLTAEDREAQSELQGLLCGCLQVITVKLGAGIKPHADQMMQAFLQVFGAKNSTVHEEALMAVGAIANGERHLAPRPSPAPAHRTSPCAAYPVDEPHTADTHG